METANELLLDERKQKEESDREKAFKDNFWYTLTRRFPEIEFKTPDEWLWNLYKTNDEDLIESVVRFTDLAYKLECTDRQLEIMKEYSFALDDIVYLASIDRSTLDSMESELKKN